MGDLTGRWGLMVCASGGCERGGARWESVQLVQFARFLVRKAGRWKDPLAPWSSGSPQTRSLRESEAAMRHVPRWPRELFDEDRTHEAWVCLRSKSQERDEGQGLKGER
jgi:hypothetical protein